MEVDLCAGGDADEMEFETTEAVQSVGSVNVHKVTDDQSLAELVSMTQDTKDDEVLADVPGDNEADSEFMESSNLDSEDEATRKARERAEHDEFMTTCKQQYYTHDTKMKRCLEEILELGRVSKADHKPINFTKLLTAVKHCQLHRRAATVKYNNATEGRKKAKKTTVHAKHPATQEEISARLRGPEELKNPWIPTPETAAKLPASGILMRVSDEASQAKIYPDTGILSGGSAADLTTDKGRRDALASHLNWGNRKATVFISFTGCADNFIKWRIPQILKRDGKKSSRHTAKLTFINTHSLVAAGCVILPAKKEIHRLKVPIPSTYDISWFEDEYLIPFRVSTEHIVGTYCWTAVEAYMISNNCDFAQWHADVVLPASAEHEAARKEGRQVKSNSGCVCCGH